MDFRKYIGSGIFSKLAGSFRTKRFKNLIRHLERDRFMGMVPYATYIPFIGWLLPMALIRNVQPQEFHTRQAFILSVGALAVQIFLYTVSSILPNNLQEIRLGFVILIYMVYLLYLGLAVHGTWGIRKGRQDRLPLITRFAEALDI